MFDTGLIEFEASVEVRNGIDGLVRVLFGISKRFGFSHRRCREHAMVVDLRFGLKKLTRGMTSTRNKHFQFLCFELGLAFGFQVCQFLADGFRVFRIAECFLDVHHLNRDGAHACLL